MTSITNDLLYDELFIAGEWCPSVSGRRIPILNPATGETIAEVAYGGRDDTRMALDRAAEALPAWARLTAVERARFLRRWYDLILSHIDELAAILTAEQGKPIREARAEIAYGAQFIEWFAEEGKRAYGEIIPTNLPGRRLLTIKQPVGVTAAVTPWNFPMAMIARKVGPAMAAGCPMVIKPASETPLSALALAGLAVQAGVPEGVLSVIPGPGSEVGDELATNKTVKAISFTGSTEVGKRLMAQAAGTVKKVALELGGNAPILVFDDADLDTAVDGVMASKFRNAGQTCVCANRIYVQDGIYEDFISKFNAAVQSMTVGDGLDADTDQGPLINDEAVAKVEHHIADAVSRGATVTTGGGRHGLGGTYFEPTVIVGATSEMAVAQEETFGPLAAVFRFKTEAEGIAQANDTPFGLAAYFFTRDLARAWRVGEGLEYGVVAVNTGSFSYEGAPFGGVKESGVGREGSAHGIEEFLDIKYMCIDGLETE